MIKIIPTWVWLLAIGASAVGSGIWAYNTGQDSIQNKWDESRRKGEKIVADLKAKAGRITVKQEIVYRDRIKEIEVKGDTITKYVPKYIPIGTGCISNGMLTGAFRVLHDGAVDNRIPDSTEITNGEAVSVTEATETITTNYKLCHKAYAAVEEWQIWAEEQCKLNSKGCPSDGG